MITGFVNAHREAVIVITVTGPSGRQQKIEAVIDTGFDGWLSLPPPLVRALELPWRRSGRGILADGSESLFDIFEARIDWDRRKRRISVDAVDATPLVGMSLLEGYQLNLQVRSRGRVRITRLA
jgi:clan AA aspartic protease